MNLLLQLRYSELHINMNLLLQLGCSELHINMDLLLQLRRSELHLIMNSLSQLVEMILVGRHAFTPCSSSMFEFEGCTNKSTEVTSFDLELDHVFAIANASHNSLQTISFLFLFML